MFTTVTIGSNSVPWLSLSAEFFSGSVESVHLSPANGLPLASYQELFDRLTGHHHITGMDCRGAWPEQKQPPTNFNWLNHADDLIAGLENKHSKPIIGMGHSMGATMTAIAAIKRPELFSKIVLIDPATMPLQIICSAMAVLPEKLIFKLVPWIKRTHNRQRIWSSPDAFYENYRDHPTYRAFTDNSMHHYAHSGLRERKDKQYELVYDPTWEAFNFRKVHYLWGTLAKITVPTLLLRAEHSHLYSATQFANKSQKLPSIVDVKTVPGAGHLLTHESPEILADMILDWLA